MNRLSPWAIAKDISWSVLPLVAGLFILVEAVEGTGVLKPLISWLPLIAITTPPATALGVGSIVAVLCNLLNNLPLGLIAGTVASSAQLSSHLTGAMPIDVDLGSGIWGPIYR